MYLVHFNWKKNAFVITAFLIIMYMNKLQQLEFQMRAINIYLLWILNFRCVL